MKINPLLFALVLFFAGCASAPSTGSADRQERARNEVLEAERLFAQMAQRDGVMEAFLHYAADSAVLIRGNQAFKGKEGIRAYFEENPNKNVQLNWRPVFVEASEGGDMAYTYGPYIYTAQDPEGFNIRLEGIFHTVWKRQADGQWKFVYD